MYPNIVCQGQAPEKQRKEGLRIGLRANLHTAGRETAYVRNELPIIAESG